MTGKAHLTIGILIGFIFISFFPSLAPHQYFFSVLIVSAASLLPDIDTDGSFIQYSVRGWGKPALTRWFLNYKNRKTFLGTLIYIVMSFLELIIRAILIATFGTVAKLVVHRSITHYLITPLIMFLILIVISIYFNLNLIYSVSFFIGYLSHIIEDMLTRSGVMFFFPIYKKQLHLLPGKYRLKTGVKVTKEEYVIIGIVLLIAITIVGFNIAHF